MTTPPTRLSFVSAAWPTKSISQSPLPISILPSSTLPSSNMKAVAVLIASLYAASLARAAPAPAADFEELDARAATLVRTINCNLYASGHLNLVTQNKPAAPLTVLDDSLIKFTSGNHAKPDAVSFYTCDSSFMEFKSNNQKKYGILKVSPGHEGERCITSYHAEGATEGTSIFLTNDKCTYSDDSGQVLQYFEYDVASGNIIFLGRPKDGYTAASAYRYAFTTHNQVLGLEEGSDGSHFTLTKHS